MTTPTTTWDAISDQQIALLEGVTPDVDAGADFVRYLTGSPPDRAKLPIREWAGQHLGDCFRQFDIVLRGEGFAGAATQYDVEEWEARAELVVCYPIGRDSYGDGYSLEALVARDMAQVRRTIGNLAKANFVGAPTSGQFACWLGNGRKDEPFALESARGLRFAVTPLTVLYYRSNP